MSMVEGGVRRERVKMIPEEVFVGPTEQVYPQKSQGQLLTPQIMRKMRLKEFVEPSPVHGGLENHTAAGMSLDQVNEELRCAVVDAPLIKDAVCGIDRAENTVSLMEVDSDRDCVVVGWSCW